MLTSWQRSSNSTAGERVRKLDKFSKKFTESLRLGSEFVSAVVDMKFSSTQPFPRIRHAVLAVNLTSTKVVDGIARLLTKSDVAQLTSPKKRGDVQRAEDELGRMANMLSELRSKGGLLEGDSDVVEGRFMVRIGAHTCGKGKMTFEGKGYEDIDEIVYTSVQEISEMMKVAPGMAEEKVATLMLAAMPAEWDTVAVDQAAKNKKNTAKAAKTDKSAACSSNVRNVQSQRPLSIDELTTDAHAAAKKGLFIGKFAVERGMGAKHGIYVITSIGQEVVLQEFDAFRTAGLLTVKLPIAKFLDGWAPCKSDPPQRLTGDWQSRQFDSRRALEVEKGKAAVFNALLEYHAGNKSNVYDQVYLCHKPSGVRAKKKIEKGEITLVPICQLSSITTQKSGTVLFSGNTVAVDGNNMSYYIQPPQQPKQGNVAEWAADDSVHVLYWIGTTDQKDDANIAVKHVAHKNLKVPVFYNTKVIKENSLLLTYKEVIGKRPLDGAAVLRPVAKAKAEAKP
jgi:hypothetical protein